MSKELAEAVKLFISQPLNNPLSRGQIMEVARIALTILEQQEVMRVPAYYIVYHPNPEPHEYDDKEHSHCGSIHLARRIAGEIGGSICPVYIGDKLDQPTNQNGE